MDVSDDRRERDVPSLKKGCNALQAEDRKQSLRGRWWLGAPCSLGLSSLASQCSALLSEPEDIMGSVCSGLEERCSLIVPRVFLRPF